MSEMAMPTARAFVPTSVEIRPRSCQHTSCLEFIPIIHRGFYPYCFCQRSSNIRQLADSHTSLPLALIQRNMLHQCYLNAMKHLAAPCHTII